VRGLQRIIVSVSEIERALGFGAAVIDAPADQPWGERQAVLTDPDGHVVCLVAPVAN
jgi:uncharacterized glyoxalase superfamily protein PhnB